MFHWRPGTTIIKLRGRYCSAVRTFLLKQCDCKCVCVRESVDVPLRLLSCSHVPHRAQRGGTPLSLHPALMYTHAQSSSSYNRNRKLGYCIETQRGNCRGCSPLWYLRVCVCVCMRECKSVKDTLYAKTNYSIAYSYQTAIILPIVPHFEMRERKKNTFSWRCVVTHLNTCLNEPRALLTQHIFVQHPGKTLEKSQHPD